MKNIKEGLIKWIFSDGKFMSVIIPAIIPESLRDLHNQIDQVSFADSVQIDVVDGVFVPSVSWPYKGEVPHFDLTKSFDSLEIGIDLMVKNPLQAAKDWLSVGANRLVFHIESLSVDDIEEVFDLHDNNHFELALSCNNDTPIQSITRYLDSIDYVQLMGISKIGSQGQTFDERVISRVEILRKEHPELIISIDGSMNAATIPVLKEAGANRFVVGSAILKEADKRHAYDELLNLVR